jgi:hypothetical protein
MSSSSHLQSRDALGQHAPVSRVTRPPRSHSLLLRNPGAMPVCVIRRVSCGARPEARRRNEHKSDLTLRSVRAVPHLTDF